MLEFQQIISSVGHYLSLIRIVDVIDIAIIAFAIYKLFSWSKSTNADKILKSIAIFLLVMWVSSALGLQTVSYILSHVVEWGILAIIVIFQPEIRQILERVGSKDSKFLNLFKGHVNVSEMEETISEIVKACDYFSDTKTGALIVFERGSVLDEQIKTGTSFDASTNTELIKNIFFINAPMHDGAMIIRNARIIAAGCMLPLTRNKNVAKELGMRHRAGMGLSENSDAVVVIVSEETGSISVAIGGIIKRHLSPTTLELLLRNELIPEEETIAFEKKSSFRDFLANIGIGGKEDEK